MGGGDGGGNLSPHTSTSIFIIIDNVLLDRAASAFVVCSCLDISRATLRSATHVNT